MDQQILNIDIKRKFQLNKDLYSIQSYKSLSVILFEWVLIFSAFLIFDRFQNPLLLIVLIPFVATRMYALYSLLHESLHYLLVGNKKLNDFLARFLLAYPLFNSLNSFRKIHLSHHKYLKTERDPESLLMKYEEFIFPMSKRKIVLIFLMDITGINFLKYKALKLLRKPTEFFSDDFGYLLFHLVILFLLFQFGYGRYYFLLWVIPYITVYQLLNRLRLYTEHINLDNQDNTKTRTLKLGPLQRFFLAPYNLGFHTEHHLFPGVPFYNLPKIHKIIHESPKSEEYEVVTNYFKLFNYLVK